ncbi:MAG TPA: beta-1,3-glucanase family protein [Nakamurella sp.]|nr:beta-1,3-glucanase family protein [Nakamurella sp.]
MGSSFSSWSRRANRRRPGPDRAGDDHRGPTNPGDGRQHGWRDLIGTRNGTVLRVLSPNLTALSPGWSGTLDGHLDSYMKQAWQKHTTTDLRIYTQSAWGRLSGRVGANGLLTFPGVGSFARPATPFSIAACHRS